MKKMKWMSKKIAAMTMATLLGVGMFSTTAFAYVDESEIAEEETEICTETEKIEEPTEEVIAYDPLTPDGNLDLVDDYGDATKVGKQFITVVTKAGNYFYIIIDRDDEGDETVHFLNMVDEADLLKLMDDEEAQAYIDSIAGTQEKVEEIEETPTEEAPETEEPGEEEKKSSKTGLLVFLLFATVGGSGGYVYLKSKKKDTKKPGPDPDIDYTDEEEDYLAGLSEGDDFEEDEVEEESDGEEN